MKKILALSALLLASIASAQSIDSSQIKTKTNGGIRGDATNLVYVGPFIGTSAPASPQTGQMWFDTSLANPTCKFWNGSWLACSTYSAATTQTDITSFPGSPTDGQFFIDKTRDQMWYYNGTDTFWHTLTGGAGIKTGGAGVNDNFAASVITAPGGAPTISDGGAGGNMTAGTHTCRVVFANSTGGETSVSAASSVVTFTASHKITWNAAGTGGTGTTQIRLYCDKAGDLGTYYWVDTNTSNTTSPQTGNGIADGSMLILAPNRNYSGALNGRWTVTNNTAQTTSGGCGSTGSSMLCRISHSGSASFSSVSTDIGVIPNTSLTSFNTGDYTLQYRVVSVENGFGLSFLAGTAICGGMHYTSGGVTTLAAGPRDLITECGPAANAGPYSSSNIVSLKYINRTTDGGASGSAIAADVPFPKISSFPYYVKWVKRGAVHMVFVGKDASNWTPLFTTTNNVNPADSTIGIAPANAYDIFDFPVGSDGNTAKDVVLEVDGFSITAN